LVLHRSWCIGVDYSGPSVFLQSFDFDFSSFLPFLLGTICNEHACGRVHKCHCRLCRVPYIPCSTSGCDRVHKSGYRHIPCNKRAGCCGHKPRHHPYQEPCIPRNSRDSGYAHKYSHRQFQPPYTPCIKCEGDRENIHHIESQFLPWLSPDFRPPLRSCCDGCGTTRNSIVPVATYGTARCRALARHRRGPPQAKPGRVHSVFPPTLCGNCDSVPLPLNCGPKELNREAIGFLNPGTGSLLCLR
jgi:hypothetical protein